MRPLIGITCSRIVGGAWGLYSPGHFMDYTFTEYNEAVVHCGGAAVLIPIIQNRSSLRTILDRVDGLILSGGPDINPKRYGEAPVPGMGEIDAALDDMELALAKLAFQKDIPLLGICRGIQVLNVALGGTLYQDIAAQIPEGILHTQRADKSVLTHRVRIEPETLLERVLKRREIWVNGRHHQAVKDVAAGFRIAASAGDGVVEAMEHPSKPFAIGVQWHPEGTWKKDAHSKKLFRALVQAAGGMRE